jgi:hypothetical protein
MLPDLAEIGVDLDCSMKSNPTFNTRIFAR